MLYPHHAKVIIAMKNADLSMREKLLSKKQLVDTYHPQMEELHNAHADQLQKIIEDIGYPSIKKVGKEANESAWLIVQHAISRPLFMKYCLTKLEAIIDNNEAKIQAAYLSDRIAMYENRLQLYGTQYDWDQEGNMSPVAMDDINQVNKRRKTLGLKTVEEQTLIMRKQVMKEQGLAPINLGKRKKAYNEWRKRVGWLN